MKLIDARQTPYGTVVDVQLDNAALSFSMPYAEYCELERTNQLTEEAAIESNIRFMSQVRELRTPPNTRIVDGVSSPEWFKQIKPISY
jgi:hypothetical protein